MVKTRGSQAKQLLDRDTREIHVSLNSQMEGSKIVSGCIQSNSEINDGLSSHKKNFIYTIEVACATNRVEKAIRVSLFNQTDNFSIVEVLFADRTIFEMGIEVKEELKFAL